MRKALRKFKGYTGTVLRDLRRQIDQIPKGVLRERVLDKLVLVSRLLHQTPKGRAKISALHEPQVDCISKGKARVRYEFGTKISVGTTLKGGFVVGMRSLPGNPYDGHTLAEALEQVAILTDHPPKRAVVDRGYRGHRVEGTQVLISGTRRGLTPALAKALRRRSSIEPEIGHMKIDGRLSRCTRKRHPWGRDPRGALRLWTQHPKDPRPPRGTSCRPHFRDPGHLPAETGPPIRLQSCLIADRTTILLCIIRSIVSTSKYPARFLLNIGVRNRAYLLTYVLHGIWDF